MLRATDLYDWQKRAVERGVHLRRALFLADPGEGKTVTVLTILKMLSPGRALIVAPASVCKERIWELEASNWTHLSNLEIKNLQQLSARDRAIGSTGINVISYALIPWLMKAIAPRKLHQVFDAVVFDEVSKLKAPGSVRFQKLRRQIVDVPIRFGLTGSPVGNSLLNVWGETFMACGPRVFDCTFTKFKETYFVSDFNGWNFTPLKGAHEQIIGKLKPHTIYPAKAREGGRVSFKPVHYELPAKVQKEYDTLAKDFVVELGGDTLYGANSAVLAGKLKQIESGAIYLNTELGEEPSGEWKEVHSDRTLRAAALAGELQKPLLIFYEYRHELERLKQVLPGLSHIKDKDAVARWNRNEIQVLAAHPASAGHGLNLHLGGAHNLLFFTTPWSLELFEQCIGRLDRAGQANQVNAYYFTGTKIADDVMLRLADHSQTQQNLKNNLAQKT